MPLQGFVDICSADLVAGWAWNSDQPDVPVPITIWDGDLLLRTLLAQDFRPDLQIAGVRTGYCAFRFRVPPRCRDDQTHHVHVRFAATELDLTHSPQSVVWCGSDRYSDELGRLLMRSVKRLPWQISSAEFTPEIVRIAGWALPPRGDTPVTITLNARPFERVNLSLPSPDFGDVFFYWPGAESSGFTCETTTPGEVLFQSGPAVLEYSDARTGKPLYSFHNFYWPSNLLTCDTLPSGKDMMRVAGHSDRHIFLQDGYTTFRKIKHVLTQVVGQWPEGETLDWGCGCGRVTRWLIDDDLPGVRVCGADIDPVNIQWCANHLGSAVFQDISLHPPTPFKDGQFSVILGMSVFTHLSEPAQFEWLQELRRISKPGGLLLMSVNVDDVMCRVLPTMKLYQDWLKNGFDATIPDPSLNEVIADKEYYRLSFHTHEYLRNHWAKYFDIVTIIEGFMSNIQDLVVLRAA